MKRTFFMIAIAGLLIATACQNKRQRSQLDTDSTRKSMVYFIPHIRPAGALVR